MFFFDKIITLLIFFLLAIFRPDLVMIGAYILLFPYLYLTSRKRLIYHLFVSSGVALIWMIFAHNQYGYNKEMLTIFGITIYPLFAWATGLFLTYILYSHLEHKINSKSYAKKMLLFIAIYWPLLISIETIAYHVFNIQNASAAIYNGIPFFNCIHAPIWMQISYFALGLIYFGICELIGLENPHNINEK